MTEPTPAHDLLARVCAGDLPPDDPAVLDVLRRDPGLAADLEQMLAARQALETVGSRVRLVLARAREPQHDLPEVDVRAVIDRLRQPRPRPARRLPPLLVAAAACLAVGLLVWIWWRPGPDPDRVRLGGGVEVQQVQRLADGGLHLAWSCRVPAATFMATLRGNEGPPLSAELNRPEWTLTATQAASLRATARLTIEARDAFGTPVAGAELTLSLPR